MAKVVAKGGDIASTIAGAKSDIQTLRDPNASTGQKVMAAVSLGSEALSPVSVRDAKAAVGLQRT